MVRAAQKAAFDKADEDNVVVKTKFVGGIAQVRMSSRIGVKGFGFNIMTRLSCLAFISW